ncbi:hypothetical protein QBC39DRAFT_342874 [Podospora conica]|nr:hypothetical protein QBC39DRAFT_342874 [Schizothecium conicum]
MRRPLGGLMFAGFRGLGLADYCVGRGSGYAAAVGDRAAAAHVSLGRLLHWYRVAASSQHASQGEMQRRPPAERWRRWTMGVGRSRHRCLWCCGWPSRGAAEGKWPSDKVRLHRRLRVSPQAKERFSAWSWWRPGEIKS